mgnify:CR=1 FL=1
MPPRSPTRLAYTTHAPTTPTATIAHPTSLLPAADTPIADPVPFLLAALADWPAVWIAEYGLVALALAFATVGVMDAPRLVPIRLFCAASADVKVPFIWVSLRECEVGG